MGQSPRLALDGPRHTVRERNTRDIVTDPENQWGHSSLHHNPGYASRRISHAGPNVPKKTVWLQSRQAGGVASESKGIRGDIQREPPTWDELTVPHTEQKPGPFLSGPRAGAEGQPPGPDEKSEPQREVWTCGPALNDSPGPGAPETRPPIQG